MKHYSEDAVERMMKVQEVIMRALAKKIRWYEGAANTSQCCNPHHPSTMDAEIFKL